MAAARLPLHALPWLPRPPGTAREQLAKLPAEQAEAILAAREVTRNFLDEPMLSALGRKVRQLLVKSGPDLDGALKTKGLVPLHLLIFSASSISHVTDGLIGTALRHGFALRVTVAEYEAPEAWLERHRESLEETPPDVALLALDARMVALDAPFGDEAAAEKTVADAMARVDRLICAVTSAVARPLIVQTLAADPDKIQMNMDAGFAGSPRNLIAEFNRRLMQKARSDSLLVLDIASLAGLVGAEAWAAGRFAYVAKHPFAMSMTPLYAEHVVRLLSAQRGRTRRVLVLDLDNTLWGGVVGDDGVEGLRLGGGTAEGEAHAALQKLALGYKERGVILCVSSKNDEAVALDAFRRHPEMVLRESDVVAFRINWDDKAANIQALASTLDLGLESFVFIDDNPAERKRVRDALPAVAVPELPASPGDWIPVIHAAGYFEQVSFSSEDRKRTDSYKENAARAAQLERIGNYDDYLRSLGMTLSLLPFDQAGRKRIVQLIAKSNQFNLTTRRYGESEVAALETDADAVTLQARLTDLFGDNGMISVVVCRKQERAWEVDTWLMSCRVLGRRVEETILQHLVARARADGAEEIRGRYVPTPRNALVRDHFEKLGFAKVSAQPDGETTWRLSLANYVDKKLPIDVETAP